MTTSKQLVWALESSFKDSISIGKQLNKIGMIYQNVLSFTVGWILVVAMIA